MMFKVYAVSCQHVFNYKHDIPSMNYRDRIRVDMPNGTVVDLQEKIKFCPVCEKEIVFKAKP